jgi:hypothetical protein
MLRIWDWWNNNHNHVALSSKGTRSNTMDPQEEEPAEPQRPSPAHQHNNNNIDDLQMRQLRRHANSLVP